MKNYASFQEWKADQSERNKDLIHELQKCIEQTAPHLTTTVKWGQGYWEDDKHPRVFIHAEEDHVQLGFYNGSSLDDPANLLSGSGKYIRFIRVYNREEIKPELYSDLIKQATAR